MTDEDPFAEPRRDPRDPGSRGLLAQSLRDPAQRATWLGVVLLLVGFFMLYAGWRSVAATLDVFVQLPFALSAGAGGVALIGTALALLNVQSSRYAEAVARDDEQRVIAAWSDLEASVVRRAEPPAA